MRDNNSVKDYEKWSKQIKPVNKLLNTIKRKL
jgi:hypothetical protein